MTWARWALLALAIGGGAASLWRGLAEALPTSMPHSVLLLTVIGIAVMWWCLRGQGQDHHWFLIPIAGCLVMAGWAAIAALTLSASGLAGLALPLLILAFLAFAAFIVADRLPCPRARLAWIAAVGGRSGPGLRDRSVGSHGCVRPRLVVARRVWARSTRRGVRRRRYGASIRRCRGGDRTKRIVDLSAHKGSDIVAWPDADLTRPMLIVSPGGKHVAAAFALHYHPFSPNPSMSNSMW